MRTSIVFVLFLICLANAAKKDLECRIKRGTSFGSTNTNITMCTLDFAKYTPGKTIKFSEATNDFGYETMRVKFNESSIQAIPTIIFDEFRRLEILELNWVGLRNIYPNSFTGAESLKVLQAFGNKLTTLNGFAFDGAKNLEILDLSQNLISNINVETFAGLELLKELSLSSNRISILDEQTFQPLKNLTWIWLDRNEIKIIAVNLLVSSQSLQGMYLNDNSISALSPILLDRLPELRFLFLSGNNCTSSNFINTQIASNSNVKKELATCFNEFRTIVPDEEEKYKLKNILRDADKANSQCETDKATLLKSLESTRQQLTNLEYKKNGK